MSDENRQRQFSGAKWSEEDDKKLKALWIFEGKSATEISNEFSDRFTRNAVLGRVHRLKIHRSQKIKKPIKPIELVEPIREEIKNNQIIRFLRIMELTSRTCRWPIGDPLDEGFRYCGDEIKNDSPYCLMHHSVAYISKKEKVSFSPENE